MNLIKLSDFDKFYHVMIIEFVCSMTRSVEFSKSVLF